MKKELNTKEAKNAIKKMSEEKIKTIVISGGEPFTRKDWKQLVKELNDYDFKLKLCTNGSLLKEKDIEYLINNNVKGFQLSLDSLKPEVFNYLRKPNTKNAFEKTIQLIKTLPTFNTHTILATVPLKTNEKEIIPLMDFAYETGIETFSLYKPIPTGRGQEHQNIFIQETDYLRLMDKWIEHFQGYEKKWIIEVEQPYAQASGILNKWNKKTEIHFTGCKAGKTFLSLNPKGKIMICPGIDIPACHIGDIKENSLTEAWNDNKILPYFTGEKKPVGCEKCNEWNTCYGGCRACAIGLTGNPIAKDPLCNTWFNYGKKQPVLQKAIN